LGDNLALTLSRQRPGRCADQFGHPFFGDFVVPGIIGQVFGCCHGKYLGVECRTGRQ
jgi:hypothetical protein